MIPMMIPLMMMMMENLLPSLFLRVLNPKMMHTMAMMSGAGCHDDNNMHPQSEEEAAFCNVQYCAELKAACCCHVLKKKLHT
jgi:hypothetical protein